MMGSLILCSSLLYGLRSSYLIENSTCLLIHTLSDLDACADSIDIADVVIPFALKMLAEAVIDGAEAYQLAHPEYTRFHLHKLSIELARPERLPSCDNGLE